MFKTNKMIRPNFGLILYIILFILVVFYLFPLIWLVGSSLKNNTTIFTEPWAIPTRPEFKNYVTAWSGAKFYRYFINSIVVTVASLTASLFLGSMTAYAIARMKWKLSKLTMLIFLIGMMVPIHCTLIPIYITFAKMSLINTYWGLIIPYVAFGFPTTIYIMTGFFSSLPREMEEAAVIDGCGLPTCFFKIILPISKAGLFTVSIFSFVGNWNELLVALIFTNSDNVKTLPVGLTSFVGVYSTNYAPMLAAIVIAVLPTIAVYCAFSNAIVEGLTAGAVKG